jgi:hypothetical protein
MRSLRCRASPAAAAAAAGASASEPRIPASHSRAPHPALSPRRLIAPRAASRVAADDRCGAPRAALAALAALALPLLALAATITLPAGSPKPLTTGSVLVLRVGDGSAALTSTATPGWLDEFVYSASAWSWVNSVALPCTFAATSSAEAFISAAPDASAV